MFTAIMFGFSIVVLIHSITYGALETVGNKAARYFSGHISINGYTRTSKYIDSPGWLKSELEEADLPIRNLSLRTVYYRTDSSLFFNGDSVRQRRLVGIDTADEAEEFSSLDFLEGSFNSLSGNDASGSGILISEVAADILNARVGDSIILSLKTLTGQQNSEALIVRGIFRETSLFGYLAYMNRADLNRLLNAPADYATDIAVFAHEGSDTTGLIFSIRDLLKVGHELLEPVKQKSELEEKIRELDVAAPVLALIPLGVHLDQITIIMDTVKIVTWVIQVLFMLIIMVGILNTYRVLVYERTREIGTLRAMGMTRHEIRFMFLYEALILDLIACISGFAFFRVIVEILERMDISRIPGAGLFTEKGHLFPLLDHFSLTVTFVLMLAAVLVAAWGPASRASGLSPVDAMREEN